jgi:hypothetical protein
MSSKSQRSWRHVPFPLGMKGDAPRPEGSIWETFLRCQEKVTAMATSRALRLDASVPNPKSASFCGLLVSGLRIRRALANL